MRPRRVVTAVPGSDVFDGSSVAKPKGHCREYTMYKTEVLRPSGNVDAMATIQPWPSPFQAALNGHGILAGVNSDVLFNSKYS